MMEEMQEILLQRNGEANSQDVLVFEKELKSFCLADNIENRGRAITFGPTIVRGQYKIAPAKHIELACNNDRNKRAKTASSVIFLLILFSTFFVSISIVTISNSTNSDCQLIASLVLVIMTISSLLPPKSTVTHLKVAVCKKTCQHWAINMLIIWIIQSATHAFSSSATSSLMSFQANFVFHSNESTAFQYHLRCSFSNARTLM